MKPFRALIIVGILIALAAVPVLAKDHRNGLGIAVTQGNVDPEIGGSDLDAEGYTVFWKYGFTDMWGLLFSYRDMDDDEDLLPGQEFE